MNYFANKNKISSAVDEIVYYTMNKSLGLVTFQEVLLLFTGQVPLQMLLGLNLEKSFGGGERGGAVAAQICFSPLELHVWGGMNVPTPSFHPYWDPGLNECLY